jgi:hypothetical protein
MGFPYVYAFSLFNYIYFESNNNKVSMAPSSISERFNDN